MEGSDVSWFKLDDKSWSHGKVVMAGNAAWGALCRMGAYASDHLTNGKISSSVAQLIATIDETERLVECGLLLRLSDGSYEIHDYLRYNPSAREVKKLRKDRADAGRRGARQTNGKRSGKSSASAEHVADAVPSVGREHVVGKTSPRSRPDPDPVPIHNKKKSRSSAVAAPLPDDWSPPDNVVEALRTELHGDVLAELPAMRDWAKDKGITSKDWVARFRNWAREAARRGHLPPWEPPLLRPAQAAPAAPRKKTPEEIAAERAAGDALFDELAKVKTVSA